MISAEILIRSLLVHGEIFIKSLPQCARRVSSLSNESSRAESVEAFYSNAQLSRALKLRSLVVGLVDIRYIRA